MKKYIFLTWTLLSFNLLQSCTTEGEKSNYSKPAMIQSTCNQNINPQPTKIAEEKSIVTMKLFINKAGLVEKTKMVKSSGSKILDSATKEFFSSCTYKPATQNNLPISTWMDVTFTWSPK